MRSISYRPTDSSTFLRDLFSSGSANTKGHNDPSVYSKNRRTIISAIISRIVPKIFLFLYARPRRTPKRPITIDRLYLFQGDNVDLTDRFTSPPYVWERVNRIYGDYTLKFAACETCNIRILTFREKTSRFVAEHFEGSNFVGQATRTDSWYSLLYYNWGYKTCQIRVRICGQASLPLHCALEFIPSYV